MKLYQSSTKPLLLKGYYFKCLLAAGLFTSPTIAQDSTKGAWPHHVKIQYAGGIGFLSIGVGYTNKKQSIEGDVYYGYLPRSVGGISIHSVTGKFTGFPIRPFHFRQVELKPVSAGVLINYTFGKQYFGFSPENYPFNYYGHPTAWHVGIFVGGQLNKNFEGRLKQAGVYYELITFDREFISFVNNTKSLNIMDILNLAIGIKLSR